MEEAITEFFSNGEFWAILIKVLLTALLTAGVGVLGTLIGKIIAKSKNSKIYKYADTCVKAAEQKFPNEGKKMGPEKLQYVMDQMMIKFPKIRDNQYLYNIAEAAVFELNKQIQREAAIKDFEAKYGEKPLVVQQEESKNGSKEVRDEILKDTLDTITVAAEIDQLKNNNKETTATSEPTQAETQAQKQDKKQSKLKSF